jgi:hypothetical protein
MAADRVDWSTQALRAQYVQRWVIVRGWLLFNFEAASTSLHTADLGGPAATRATAWEIHPVTSIDVEEEVLDQQASALGQIEHQHLGAGVARDEPKGRFLGGEETVAGF